MAQGVQALTTSLRLWRRTALGRLRAFRSCPFRPQIRLGCQTKRKATSAAMEGSTAQ